MIDHVQTVIIGAGVVGLSIAKSLCDNNHDVLIVEKEKSFGMGTSSRNSEVIHAGLYFGSDTLKTKLCVSGKKKLYQYAKTRNIPHNPCGKLLVASSENELEKLEEIRLQAIKNRINDLVPLTKTRCSELEPDISAKAGLFSPSSGIIDSHSLMLTLLGDVENSGGQIAYNVDIGHINKLGHGFKIKFADGFEISCTNLINAAGLGAQKIAHIIDAMDKSNIPELVMAKGHYFSYSGKTNFKHLVYPLPFQGGLGIHLTLDMGGAVKFGPDVVYVSDEEYGLNTSNKEKFINSIKHYFPSIDPKKLTPSYAGIRPKLSKDGLDFNIQSPKEHGIEGLINLFGIESPGLTSCLAIADYVTEKLDEYR